MSDHLLSNATLEDVQQLSDKQLREQLKHHNKNVGPIHSDSVRRVLNKKLFKILGDLSKNNDTASISSVAKPRKNKKTEKKKNPEETENFENVKKSKTASGKISRGSKPIRSDDTHGNGSTAISVISSPVSSIAEESKLYNLQNPSTLSNIELRELLFKYDFKPGPISGLTRNIWEKKLCAKMTKMQKTNLAKHIDVVNHANEDSCSSVSAFEVSVQTSRRQSQTNDFQSIVRMETSETLSNNSENSMHESMLNHDSDNSYDEITQNDSKPNTNNWIMLETDEIKSQTGLNPNDMETDSEILQNNTKYLDSISIIEAVKPMRTSSPKNINKRVWAKRPRIEMDMGIDILAGSDSFNKQSEQSQMNEIKRQLRPIVVDGSNVAMSHGRNTSFSFKGLKLVYDFFKNRGHSDIYIFIPHCWTSKFFSCYKNKINRHIRSTNFEILDVLNDQNTIFVTPARQIGSKGRYIAAYDDRYILNLASKIDAVIITNDFYRDLYDEAIKVNNYGWARVISDNILNYLFVNDIFMPSDDPGGKNSDVTLERLLRF